MTLALSPILVSRLEKAATDNGFDQLLKSEGEWLAFASTQCPLRVWLGVFGDALLVALSQQNVACALDEYGAPMTTPMPKGAVGGRAVSDIPALHGLLRRTFQLSKTLPSASASERMTSHALRSSGVSRLSSSMAGKVGGKVVPAIARAERASQGMSDSGSHRQHRRLAVIPA